MPREWWVTLTHYSYREPLRGACRACGPQPQHKKLTGRACSGAGMFFYKMVVLFSRKNSRWLGLWCDGGGQGLQEKKA